MTVYHDIRGNRYYCCASECASKTFSEQFYEFAQKDARLSNRLVEFIIQQALESSANSLQRDLKEIGIEVSRDTILRCVKKKGAVILEQNLQRDNVRVLAVDDINLRKGNSSTACSVFIDGETHRVLVIVQGATDAVAQKVMKQFPSSELVSRDRGTAYASAAKKHNKAQVADGFHLVQNVHSVVKDALYQEFAQDLFCREGEGWVKIIDSVDDEGTDSAIQEDTESLVFMGPATLTENDIETRIHLAGLTDRQAKKYKRTLEILLLTESGLRTSEIAKRLSITSVDVSTHRKNAPKTINTVESKIDEYYQMREQEQWEYHQKTIAANAKPSSESIVDPYKETVLRMFMDGKNHRNIHPVIMEEGFTGSANAVYQYIIKYAHENDIPYGRNRRVIPKDERKTDDIPPRPKRISLERTSRHSIYEAVLHAAAVKREEIRQAQSEVGTSDSADSPKKNSRPNPEETAKKSSYSHSIAEIVFDTKQKSEGTKKRLSDEMLAHLGRVYPCIPRLMVFLLAFYDILLSGEPQRLDQFIQQYEHDSIEGISVFISGLTLAKSPLVAFMSFDA